MFLEHSNRPSRDNYIRVDRGTHVISALRRVTPHQYRVIISAIKPHIAGV